MLIAVTGASGLLGRPLADLLEAGGHDVRRLHRSASTRPVDLATGRGLTVALDGAQVVIHAANAGSGRRARQVLTEGTRRLLDGAPDAHHVLVSVVGAARVAPRVAAYRAKAEQEQAVIGSGASFTIVASTQFHEFLGRYLFGAARVGLAPRSQARFAPVAVAEAAAVVARAATRPPRGGTLALCGPETLSLSQMRIRPGLPVPVPFGAKLHGELAAGALLEPSPDVRGVLTWSQWVSEQLGRPWRSAGRPSS